MLWYWVGARMTKFDVESAYRNVAMRPDERYLFGMRWRELFFIDVTPPFGHGRLRSFSILSPTWSNGSSRSIIQSDTCCTTSTIFCLSVLLVLSDFADSITIARSVFSRLRLPLHPSKCERPTTVLIFLGIELNSIT